MLNTTIASRPTVLAAALALCWHGLTGAQTTGTADSRAQAASSAADDTGVVQTIVIRARGRDETQQGVPISVKAFSAKNIQDAGIVKPADFVALTPNVSLVESESVGTTFITIRGLSQVRNGDAPVAIVVDGVAQNSPKQFNQELYDVQSIEVLRGPQGALYGRNASGGAILITTKPPTNDLHGFGQLTAGSGDMRGVQVGLSGPIVSDKLLFRLGADIVDSKGELENVYLGRKADPYNSKNFRGDLRWDVSDDVRIDARFSSVRDRASAFNFVYQPTPVNADCTANTTVLYDPTLIDPNRVVRTLCANNLSLSTRTMNDFTLKSDIELGFATLTAIASQDALTEYAAGDGFPYTSSRNIDFFGSPADGTQTQYLNVTNRSLELRLTSPTQHGWRWMVGAFGLDTHRFLSSTNGTDEGLGIERLTRDPDFNSPTNPTTVWFADNNHNVATALFGNVDYDFSQRLEGSIGLRYDRDHRQQTVDYRQLGGGVPPGCSADSPRNCINTATYGALQPKFSLRFKAADGAIVYGSWGKGFRSGLFNQNGVGAAAAGAQPPVEGVSDRVKAESTASFELGYKTTLFSGKLQLNAAVFDSTVRNTPYFVFIGDVNAQVIVGIDKVHLRGGELEAVANLAPGLDTSAGVGLTQSTIEAYSVNPSAVGNWAPYVPKFSGNTGLQYRFPLSAGLRAVLRGDIIFKGRQYWDPENDGARSNLTLVNLRASIEDGKDVWSLSATVDNATNKSYNAEFVTGGFALPAQLRTTRVALRYNF